MNKEFDTDFARAQFPAFSDPRSEGWAHFDNAGGSFIPQQTINALSETYAIKIQPYGVGGPTAAIGAAMDQARIRWGEALNVAPREVQFGPSTSQNTYVLAQAFGEMLEAGDEIIVTEQDHEANSGAWRRMAEARGLTLREWTVNPDTGQLDPAEFANLLNNKTRLVSFTHCSNIVGERNPVETLTQQARAAGAWSIVDGVSWAPHEIPDVAALGCDIYLFSLYKVYGVHQGVMTVRGDLLDQLPNQSHFFNAGYDSKRLIPAGPDHAQVAASVGSLDYVDALAARHGIAANNLGEKARAISALWRAKERSLASPLLGFLAGHPHARLIGSETADENRAPTVAFVPERITPQALEAALGERQIMAGADHFYAYRVVKALGIDPESGVVRTSFLHYTQEQEVSRLIEALDALL